MNTIEIEKHLEDNNCNEVKRWEEAAFLTLTAWVAPEDESRAISRLEKRAAAFVKNHPEAIVEPVSTELAYNGELICTITIENPANL
jgi:hypothetical protein